MLGELIQKYQSVDIKTMGFPDNWKEYLEINNEKADPPTDTDSVSEDKASKTPNSVIEENDSEQLQKNEGNEV